MEWESGEAVDVLADGVVIFDRNETVVLVNRAAEQLFGVDRSKVVGAQFVDVFSLTSNDGRTWLEYNAPFEGPSTRTIWRAMKAGISRLGMAPLDSASVS